MRMCTCVCDGVCWCGVVWCGGVRHYCTMHACLLRPCYEHRYAQVCEYVCVCACDGIPQHTHKHDRSLGTRTHRSEWTLAERRRRVLRLNRRITNQCIAYTNDISNVLLLLVASISIHSTHGTMKKTVAMEQQHWNACTSVCCMHVDVFMVCICIVHMHGQHRYVCVSLHGNAVCMYA